MIEAPSQMLPGDASAALAVKVARGIKDRRPGNSGSQFRLPGCVADLGPPIHPLPRSEARMGLPAVDPFRQGADRLGEALAAL